MKNFSEITIQTFKDVLSSKILYNAVFLGLAIFIITFVSAEFSYGATSRITFDIGTGLVSFSICIVSILYGSNLLPTEIDNRTLYMVLSRPVSRGVFISAKIAGMALVLLLNLMILLSLTLLLFYIFGGKISWLIFWTFLFVYLEVVILLCLTVFLSIRVNKVLTILSVLTLWISGHAVENLKTFSVVNEDPFFMKLVTFMSIYLPNFTKLNLKRFVLNDFSLEGSFFFMNVMYCLLWIFILVFASKIAFDKKDLS